MRRYMIFLVCLVIFSSISSALLVGPGKVELAYDRGEPSLFSLSVLNNAGSDVYIEIGYVHTKYKEQFEITSGHGGKVFIKNGETAEIDFLFNYPEDLSEFGDIKLGQVRFYQVPDVAAGSFGATVAIAIPVAVNIPYPEKFVFPLVSEPMFVKPGEIVNLETTLTNYGTSIIDNLEGYYILEGENYYEEIESGKKFSVVFPSEENVDKVEFDTTGMDPQIYGLSYVAEYDGLSRTSDSTNLYVGGNIVEILQVDPLTFNANEQNSARVSLFSLLVEDVVSVVSLQLTDEKKTMQKDFSLGEYTLEPVTQKDITHNIDLVDVGPGDYELEVLVRYTGNNGQEKSNSEVFDIVLQESGAHLAPSEEEAYSTTTKVLIIGSILVILVLLVIVLILLGKMIREGRESEDI